jgi:cation/acetate symporter
MSAMNSQTTSIGHPGATAIVFFLLFLGISLGITFWAARRTRSTEDFYVAGRRIGAFQNGFALAGDFLSAAGFLGGAGIVAIFGFDGAMYSVGGLIGWPIMMFLLAEPLRNLGKYTVGDVLAYRLGTPSIRIMVAINSLILVLIYLLLQMVGAGTLVQLLFGLPYELAILITTVVMLVYVLFGGMIATTWVQVVKTILMLGIVIVLTGMLLASFGWNPAALLSSAAQRGGPGILAPGPLMSSAIETFSLGLGFVCGISSLPHVLMRFYTVPDGRAARRSLFYATGFLSFFFLLIIFVGFGAMALVGTDAIRAVDRGGNMALPLLAELLGGTPLLGFVSAISFATILAVVAGLVITGTATLSHDLWVHVVRRGKPNEKEQLMVAKIGTVALAVAAMLLGVAFRGQNLVYLVALATGVAASANFPVLILALFWKRLTTVGANLGMLTGLLGSLIVLYLSPLMQVDILHHAAPVIALRNPAIVTCPLAFLVAILGSLCTYREKDGERYAGIQRQMLLGVRPPASIAEATSAE